MREWCMSAQDLNCLTSTQIPETADNLISFPPTFFFTHDLFQNLDIVWLCAAFMKTTVIHQNFPTSGWRLITFPSLNVYVYVILKWQGEVLSQLASHLVNTCWTILPLGNTYLRIFDFLPQAQTLFLLQWQVLWSSWQLCWTQSSTTFFSRASYKHPKPPAKLCYPLGSSVHNITLLYPVAPVQPLYPWRKRWISPPS